MKLVERYLYEDIEGAVPVPDADGLWSGQMKGVGRSYRIADIIGDDTTLRNGWIVGEGDCGKTCFLKMLGTAIPAGVDSCHVRLRDYNESDSGMIENRVDSFIARTERERSVTRTKFVLIDGVDERPQLLGAIRRLLRKHSGVRAVRIWVAGRKVDGIEDLRKEFSAVKFFKLAPLSQDGVKGMAVARGVNGACFVRDARSANLIDFCSKPGGCKSCLDVYEKRSGSFPRGKTLLEDIALDLSREHRDGEAKSFEFESLSFVPAQIVEAASWLAVALVTQGKQAFDTESALSVEKGCLAIRDWITARYDSGLIAHTLRTRLFEPFGRGRYRFSLAKLPHYLAARWLVENVTERNLASIFKPRDGLLSRDAECVVTWLQVLRPGIVSAGSKALPEVYGALEKRYSRLSDDEREEFFGARLGMLEGDGFGRIVRERIADPASTQGAIQFAIEVSNRCGIDIKDVIVQALVDPTRDLTSRKELSYVLRTSRGMLADGDVAALQSLIERVPGNLLEEAIEANVLSCLWPKHLTTEALVRVLRPPLKKSMYGAYEHFCRKVLPSTFKQSLTRRSAPIFLEWACQFVAEEKPFDYMGELAREIFTFCWRWVREPEIAGLMADCVMAVVKKKSFGMHVPFADKGDSQFSGVELLDVKTFQEDQEGRFALLTALIDRMQGERLEILEYLPWQHPYPLIEGEDFVALARLAEGDVVRRAGYLRCLKTLVWRVDVKKHVRELNRLKRLFPEVKEFSVRFIRSQRRACDKREAQWARERDKREREDALRREKARQQVVRLLDENKAHGTWFYVISERMSSENWSGAVPKLHLMDTPGWRVLNKPQRKSLCDFAARFLHDVQKASGKSDASGIYIASAFVLLKDRRCLRLDGLERERLVDLLCRLFNTAYHFADDESMGAVFDEIYRDNPDVVDEALLKAIKLAYEEDYGDPLDWWLPRLRRSQYDRILSYLSAAKVCGRRLARMVASLRKFGDEGSLKGFLARILNAESGRPLDNERTELLTLAFSLDVGLYGGYLIQLLRKDPDRFEKWLGNTLIYRDAPIGKYFMELGVSAVEELYAWLCGKYPDRQRPDYEGAFTPTASDEIYFFKSRLWSLICGSGREDFAELITRIAKRFPQEGDFDYWLARARESIRNGISPDSLLSADDLKVLCKERSCARLIVSNSDELRDAVYEELQDFAETLRSELRPIRALWVEVPLRLWCQKACDRGKRCSRLGSKKESSVVFPRDESWLSDAAAIFLRERLKEAVVNREPLVSPRSYAGSLTTSGFADIKVECVLSNGNHCTVFVEVKCNFNPTLSKAVKDQLFSKYVSSQPGSAGILLCGCYDCQDWVCCDSRRGHILKRFRDVHSAQQTLNDQVDTIGASVKALAIDCSLH